MDDELKIQKHRKLSIASFITGFLSLSTLAFFKISEFISAFTKTIAQNITVNVSLGSFIGIFLPLSAVMCGSLFLKKIKKEKDYNRFLKGFAISGIVFGSIVLFIVLIFIILDLLLSDR